MNTYQVIETEELSVDNVRKLMSEANIRGLSLDQASLRGHPVIMNKLCHLLCTNYLAGDTRKKFLREMRMPIANQHVSLIADKSFRVSTWEDKSGTLCYAGEIKLWDEVGNVQGIVRLIDPTQEIIFCREDGTHILPTDCDYP